MSPRQFLAMVMTASAVLGVIGGLVALPLGVRTYHGLMTQLAQQVGNRPPPFAFDVLSRRRSTRWARWALPSPSPAPCSQPVEPPAAGPPRSCDRSEAACVLFQRA
jgi:ABC-type antimicrobial peptide transport system permease subunit